MNLSWLHKTWLRVLALTFGVVLTAFTLVSLAAAPVWPVVGVAVAAAALMWNGVTSRLDTPTCLGCGHKLTDQTGSQYGIECRECGLLNEPVGARNG